MATAKTVWGIDIGQSALKALKLRSADGQLQVEAFDIIEHPKILSQPDADRAQLVRNALEQFLARNSVTGSTVMISVPGQSSFTRFVKLPPVEPKKIPDIVRFEAEQQIPFPISEVVWRWQIYDDPDSPDVEVGIFAMKRTDVYESLSPFRAVELEVDGVQMAPLALYNFMQYDGQAAEDGATLLVDVGADKTDLVVSDGPRMWTRTIQIGGNNFTEALAKAFKLSFSKAEKLKRTAASSKYARQVFQAMRPVFSDLVQEIQRSIGFYTSLHRDTRFRRLLGLGNGFRLPGLQKFLEQNLNIPVVLADSYNKLSPSPNVNAPLFTENVRSFAVAYGLAIQGLEDATVRTNLLPDEIVTRRVWARKKPWFLAAAVLLLAALAMPLYRAHRDSSALEEDRQAYLAANNIASTYTRIKNQHRQLQGQGQEEYNRSQQYIQRLGYRTHVPRVHAVIVEAVSKAASDQHLVSKLANADTQEAREQVRAEIRNKPRDQRRMIFIESLTMDYVPDIEGRRERDDSGTGSQQQLRRGYRLKIVGRTPLAPGLLEQTLANLVDQARALMPRDLMQLPSWTLDSRQRVGTAAARGSSGVGVPSLRGFTPDPGYGAEVEPERPAGTAGPENPDPLLPDEDMSQDLRFEISLLLTIEGDGVSADGEASADSN
jgi:type IV pilus assembly protein PilM